MKEKAFQRTVKILFLVCVILFGIYYVHRTYQIRYTASPVIEVPDTPLVLSCTDGREILLSDVTASDKEDGSLTDRLILESVSTFDKNYTRRAVYAVTDSDGHVSKKTRDFTYSDYSAPRFSLGTMLRYTSLDLNAVLGNIHVSDVLDGDLSQMVKIDSFTVDGTVNGTCELVLSVTNSAGDLSRIKICMSLVASTSGLPTVYLSDYIVYLRQGSVFQAESYLSEVLSGTVGETIEKDQVVISDPVDTSVSGTYIVSYTAKNLSGQTGSAFLTVVVEP